MIINLIIARNLLLLKDFIDFNDSQENVLQVKQEILLLVENISRYYKRRDDNNKTNLINYRLSMEKTNLKFLLILMFIPAKYLKIKIFLSEIPTNLEAII